MDYFFRRHKKMNVVEIRGRLTGTEFFDMVHVTPVTPGLNGLVSYPVNESGVVQSAGTATDPVNSVIRDSAGNEIEFSQVQTHTFHDAAVAVADGVVFECNGEYTKLLIEITTTDADTQEIDFLGSVEGTNYYPLLGAKVGTDGGITTNVKTTSVTSEMWEIDITNRKYIKMDLATLTGEGATVTVTGVVS
jgi:hypothetical protein